MWLRFDHEKYLPKNIVHRLWQQILAEEFNSSPSKLRLLHAELRYVIKTWQQL